MSGQVGEAAFEELYRRLSPQLFGFFNRRGAADPTDLVAEVFTIAWRSRAKLTPGSDRAWLFGIAHRVLLSERRRLGREHEADAALARRGEAGEVIEDVDRRRVVLQALSRLRPEERELILLIEWERLTPAEAAQALGIKPGTARVRLHRARQSLAADPGMRALLTVEIGV